MNIIDLHVHSTASDGTDSPAEVVKRAKDAGLCAFALTDHDTCAGLPKARGAAAQLGIELVNGIEFSCSSTIGASSGREIHMLGLFIDDNNAYFKEFLDTLTESRRKRNEEMVRLLREAGFDISLDELYDTFGNVVITRAHFARLLLMKGYVNDIKKAFDRYLGDGCSCYVKRDRINPKTAIDMIHEAGGLAILAHPLLYKLSQSDVRELVEGLAKMGLDSVEAMYSTHSAGDEAFLKQLAKNNGLGYSGGSDYHGSNKPHIQIGIGRGGLRIGYHVLEQLKERL